MSLLSEKNQYKKKLKLEVEVKGVRSKGSDENGAKLVGIWDDFRRPLFGGGPISLGQGSGINY